MSKTRPPFADRESLGCMTIVAAVVAFLSLDSVLCFTVPPAKADSEASSESGSESGMLGRRGRRGYHRRMMMQQNQPQNRQGAAQEHQYQQGQRMEDKHLRSLNGANTTREYNFGGRHHHSQSQQSGAQSTAGAIQSGAPQTSGATGSTP